MAVQKNLSDFWREDASDDRVAELTSVLRGSDGLIGVMGSGVRAVWSTNGESETWWVRTKEGKGPETRVFLDYSPLRDLIPPFPGQAVDEVIGYASHEGGHCLWSSENGRDEAISAMQKRPTPATRSASSDRAKVEAVLRVANIIEDAFIDFHVSEQWPVLGEYIRISRQKVGERRPIDLDAIARDPRPNYNQMVNLWIACSLYDCDLPKRMSARVRRAMTLLMSKSIEAVQTQHPSVRMELSVDCWEHLTKNFPKGELPLPRREEARPKAKPEIPLWLLRDEHQPLEWLLKGEAEAGGAGAGGDNNKEDKGEAEAGGEAEAETEAGEQEHGHFGGEAEEEQEEGEEREGGEQGGDEAGSPGNLDDFDIRDIEEMPEELLEEVLDAIVHEMEDISRSVAEVISKPIQDVMAQTKKADYDGPAAERVRNEVENEIQEMRRIFDRQAALQSRYLKGLTVGKLDNRSLARVGAGNLRVFKRREVLETPDLAVGLLLDVSGSMSGSMSYVWATGCVFAESLVRKRGVNFLALTYTGGYFEVETTRICDRDMARFCIGNVSQGGGTPSGPALASMKILMDRMRERQKVIIHFTDGHPDEAYSVLTAVEACRKAGYQVWAISLQGYERMLQQQYGDGNWETIGSISELPAKVTNLVKNLVATR